MEYNSTYLKEELREAKRYLVCEREQLQEQIDKWITGTVL